MKVLVIGSGGREHALTWKISQSNKVDKIYAAPGNAGMAGLAECVAIGADDIEALLEFAQKESIDLTVVGPEAPLVAGIVDVFQSRGLKVFGPSAQAAQLEGSKIFSKEQMRKFGVPTADYQTFSAADKAKAYLAEHGVPVVVKVDGLAAGKGVLICKTMDEAFQAVDLILKDKAFGEAGARILIEDCLNGPELSILAFTDGNKVVPLASSQDHKRAFDNDEGPNTGGMGAYSPCPLVEESALPALVAQTITPLVQGMAAEGNPYRGLIYAGIMFSDGEPYVLEYNCRFGDPEAQAVLPRLKGDFVEILEQVIAGNLKQDKLAFRAEACISVVLATKGYPGSYEKGFVIDGLDEDPSSNDVIIFHAGTKHNEDGKIVTAGGRVLNVTALGPTLQDARDRAYQAIKHIQCDQLFCRQDIAKRALIETS